MGIFTHNVPGFDNTVKERRLERGSSTQHQQLTQSCTAMFNKRNIIVDVEINVAVQRLEEENKKA
jgi:hypothetical protein